MKYKQISQEEREQIYIYEGEGKKKKEIAKILGRSPSTIGREIKRNSTILRGKRGGSKNEKKYYLPDRAQKKAEKRREDKKSPYPLKNPFIYHYVLEHLVKDKWSPEAIAGRLALETGGKHTISPEAIYQFIYSKKGREKELWKCLVRAHKKRRIKGCRTERDEERTKKRSIWERDIEASERREFGHFEGDSIIGKGNTGDSLNTLVERVSLYTAIQRIFGKSSEETLKVTRQNIGRIGQEKISSITIDRGTEFAKFPLLEAEYEIKIFYCDPYSSWQKGINENTNGLIRRFFPKKTDFSLVSNEALQKAEDWINNYPRKELGFRTPKEVFDELSTLQKNQNAHDTTAKSHSLILQKRTRPLPHHYLKKHFRAQLKKFALDD